MTTQPGEKHNVKGDMTGQEADHLRLPPSAVRHGRFDDLRHAQLPLRRQKTNHLVDDAHDANEECNSEDRDDAAHIPDPNLIVTLLRSFRRVHELVHRGRQRALIDCRIEIRNGEIDRMLKRQRKNLDIVRVARDINLGPQAPIRTEGIVPHAPRPLVGRGIEHRSAETGRDASDRTSTCRRQINVLAQDLHRCSGRPYLSRHIVNHLFNLPTEKPIVDERDGGPARTCTER